MVMGRAVALTAAGMAVGIAGALGLTRLLQSLVYGVTTLDPLTFALVPCVLAAVGGLAALLPARRAGAVDPVRVLSR